MAIVHEMTEEGKRVTWRYVGGVIVEALFLLGFGWLLLTVAAILDAVVRGL